MHTVQTDPAPGRTQRGRGWPGWLLALAGFVLLAASVVMMAVSA